VKAEAGDSEPRQSKNCDDARSESAPVVIRRLVMFEARSEKMKVNHPTNRQRFGDVDPEQPFHFIRLTGSKLLGQDARGSHA